MAKDNTLLYVALGIAGYYLYTRYTGAAPLSAGPASVTVVSPGAGSVIKQPILRTPKPPIYTQRIVTLPNGQDPPAAPPGYYWVKTVSGAAPAIGAPVTWALTRDLYVLQGSNLAS